MFSTPGCGEKFVPDNPIIYCDSFGLFDWESITSLFDEFPSGLYNCRHDQSENNFALVMKCKLLEWKTYKMSWCLTDLSEPYFFQAVKHIIKDVWYSKAQKMLEFTFSVLIQQQYVQLLQKCFIQLQSGLKDRVPESYYNLSLPSVRPPSTRPFMDPRASNSVSVFVHYLLGR